MLALQTTPATGRRTKKKIYGWHELIDILASPPKIPDTEIAKLTARRAASRYAASKFALVTERLVAVARQSHILLAYARTKRGQGVDDSQLQECVYVHPAAGGRTTYMIEQSVDGWFANNHLPMNARELSRSVYRSTRWMHGRDAIYAAGHGPYYPDAGPDCAHPTLEDTVAAIQGAPDVPTQWRQAAEDFCRKVQSAAAPFKETVVRYEWYEPGELFSVQYRRRVHTCISSPYGLRIRLKSPAHPDGDGGHFQRVPDFSATITGPLDGLPMARGALYCGELLEPGGVRCGSIYTGNFATGLSEVFYVRPAEVIEAARQWAASRIYIPCA
jgi:hypothetical protein